MPIEEQLAEIKHEIRSTNNILEDLAKAIKLANRTQDLITPPTTPESVSDEMPNPTTAPGSVFDTQLDDDFENVDFTVRDKMGCPYDPSIMTESRKINATGAMKGCFAKKRDKNYDESQYLLDRRVLINAAKSRSPVLTPPTAEEGLPPAPVIGAPTISNVPPAAPLEQPPITLPVIAATTTIDEDDFSALCTTFVLKYHNGNEGAKIVTEKLTACGQPGKTPGDMVGPQFQEIRAWIADEIIKYDGQS